MEKRTKSRVRTFFKTWGWLYILPSEDLGFPQHDTKTSQNAKINEGRTPSQLFDTSSSGFVYSCVQVAGAAQTVPCVSLHIPPLVPAMAHLHW